MKKIARTIINRSKRIFYTHFIYSQPTVLNIFTTNRCNFSCIYCSRNIEDSTQYDLHHYDDQSDFLFDDLVFLIKKYPRIKNVSFVGIGEPFLVNGLIPMAKFAKSHGKHVSVITNASLLHYHWGNIAQFFDGISVSLHGFDADDLSRVAKVKHQTYGQVIKNVQHLALIERKTNPSLCLRASVVVLKGELERIRRAAQFCCDNFIPILDLQNYLPYDLSSTEQCIFNDDIAEISYIEYLINEFSKVVKINPPIPIKREVKDLSWGCLSFFRTLRVDGLGQVSGCARMMVPKKEYGGFREEVNVWGNRYFSEMRKRFRNSAELPQCCRFCPESQ